jgi:hypothetical protein
VGAAVVGSGVEATGRRGREREAVAGARGARQSEARERGEVRDRDERGWKAARVGRRRARCGRKEAGDRGHEKLGLIEGWHGR